MKKIIVLAVVVLLSFGVVCSCSPKKDYTEDAKTAYLDYIADYAKTGQKVYYLIEDIDGDDVYELIIQESPTITVYAYDGKAVILERKNIVVGNEGTMRFFSSENEKYPGIFLFGTGGGLESYSYLTIEDDKISVEKLWDEDFSDAFDDRERIVEYSEDKELIAESKALYDAGDDIIWSDYEYPEWNAELKETYDKAMLKHKSAPENYRHPGVPQRETGEIVEIDGQYYQSYVASNADMRYIFMKKDEYLREVGGQWDWVLIGTEKTYSLDLIGKVDEGRK